MFGLLSTNLMFNYQVSGNVIVIETYVVLGLATNSCTFLGQMYLSWLAVVIMVQSSFWKYYSPILLLVTSLVLAHGDTIVLFTLSFVHYRLLSSYKLRNIWACFTFRNSLYSSDMWKHGRLFIFYFILVLAKHLLMCTSHQMATIGSSDSLEKLFFLWLSS